MAVTCLVVVPVRYVVQCRIRLQLTCDVSVFRRSLDATVRAENRFLSRFLVMTRSAPVRIQVLGVGRYPIRVYHSLLMVTGLELHVPNMIGFAWTSRGDI